MSPRYLSALVLTDSSIGKEWVLVSDVSAQFTIGRSSRCNISLSNEEISALHTLVVFNQEENYWRVTDLGSKLGTVITKTSKDYRRCLIGGESERLDDNDRLSFGGRTLSAKILIWRMRQLQNSVRAVRIVNESDDPENLYHHSPYSQGGTPRGSEKRDQVFRSRHESKDSDHASEYYRHESKHRDHTSEYYLTHESELAYQEHSDNINSWRVGERNRRSLSIYEPKTKHNPKFRAESKNHTDFRARPDERPERPSESYYDDVETPSSTHSAAYYKRSSAYDEHYTDDSRDPAIDGRDWPRRSATSTHWELSDNMKLLRIDERKHRGISTYEPRTDQHRKPTDFSTSRSKPPRRGTLRSRNPEFRPDLAMQTDHRPRPPERPSDSYYDDVETPSSTHSAPYVRRYPGDSKVSEVDGRDWARRSAAAAQGQGEDWGGSEETEWELVDTNAGEDHSEGA